MPRPSDAQKEAGNYPKPRISLHGLSISIENRKGTIRSGKDAEGRPWSVVLPYDYGYIRRTMGADGDQVDVFVGPNRTSQFVVVVNQYDRQTNKFDEVKVGLGYLGLEQAKAAYRQGYRGRNVPRATFVPTTVQRLKEWLQRKQTWAHFELSAGLTVPPDGMKTVEFRARQPEDKPSVARRVAAALGGAAVLGAFYRYKYNEPAAVKRRADLRNRESYGPLGHYAYPKDAKPYTGGDKFDYGVGKAKPAPAAPASVEVKAAAAPKAPSQPAGVLKREVLNPKVLKYKDVTKPKIKAELSKLGIRRMGARVQLVEFQDRYGDGTFGVSTNPLTYYRKASRITPWVNRAGQTAGDLGDMASGKKVKDPFYKKSWFKRAVTTAAIGLPIYAAGLAHAGARRTADGMQESGRLDRISRKLGRVRGAAMQKLGLSAKLKPVMLAAVVHHIQNFDFDSAVRGWDLRDARGRSARVYAPGSRRRDRREKTWNEKTDNIRLVRNIAIGTTAAATGAALFYRNRARRIAAPAAKPVLSNVVQFPGTKAMSARVNPVQFAGKSAHSLGRVIDATKANLPERPELPGEAAVKVIYALPPKQRAGVLRILGAGATLGTGVAGGVLLKRPKTGAALGGLGAGMLLR